MNMQHIPEQTVAGNPGLTFVHLSDLHFTRPRPRWYEFGLKLALGLPAWYLYRRRIYDATTRAALARELRHRWPDHVVVTGDLTSLGTLAEYRQAAAWLARLGAADVITVIPGNHDATGRRSLARGMPTWLPYCRSDPCWLPAGADGGRANPFPVVRVRGMAMFIGLSSAVAGGNPLRAAGRLGRRQLAALDALLAAGHAAGLFRVVLIHHPPHPDAVSRRKCLTDGEALLAVLGRRGVELVLHGHAHRCMHRELAGANGPVLVRGLPSATAGGRSGDRRAAFSRYRLQVLPTAWKLEETVYRFLPRAGGFAAVSRLSRQLPRCPSVVPRPQQRRREKEHPDGNEGGNRCRP
jgi:3',5'-cyclic AMP phosphodiesterase CpdA